jgi:hypothetical protein
VASSCAAGGIETACAKGTPAVDNETGPAELCNGIDDDCDGQIDEDSPVRTFFYVDSDNDTYGDNTTGVLACAAPAGYVDNSTGFDCNDNNSAVYPGATEVCNGIDDNCDGLTDEGCLTTTTTTAGPGTTTTTISDNTTTTTTAGPGTTTTTISDNTTTTTTAGPSTTTTAGPGTTTTTISDNTTSTTTTPAACTDKDGDGYGYGDNCTAGPDCDDSDAFYNEVCPDCTVKVIPKTLGGLVGEKEKTRLLLLIGTRGTVFDNATAVQWESDAITVLSKHVFFKRFMFMRAKFNGAALEKQQYRVLVGKCEGTVTWAR